MSLSDIRYTVLQVVNEVQRKLGLDQTSLTGNKLATQMVDYINDTVDDLSDYGNWQETLTTAFVTAVSGQRNYSIDTSAVIKNIGDVFFTPRRGPLRNINVYDMRILEGSTSFGSPSQFSIYGVDSNGNPSIRVHPTPGASEDGETFSVLYYTKPSRYTTSDASVIVPFPARVVVLGTLAKYSLGESMGAPTDQYKMYFEEYINARKEAHNRFNFDTNNSLSFKPSTYTRNWR